MNINDLILFARIIEAHRRGIYTSINIGEGVAYKRLLKAGLIAVGLIPTKHGIEIARVHMVNALERSVFVATSGYSPTSFLPSTDFSSQ